MTVRVHLADDHTMFREGLAAILAAREGVEVVGQTGTGKKAAAAIWRLRPDVVITQLDMRLKEAAENLRGIRSASPRSKIVVLTLWDNPRYLRAVSEMDINAIVHKDSSAEELIATLHAAGRASGGEHAVVSLPRGLIRRIGKGPVGGLSERQTEVLVLAARGLSNHRIARELHVADGTVKRHLANVYQKVGARSRNGAVRKALTEQWIGLHEIAYAGGSDNPGG